MNFDLIRLQLETDFKKNPMSDEIMSKLASSMIETRDLESALNILKKAAKDKPSAQTFTNLGYFYISIGEPYQGGWSYNLNKAIELFEEAINYSPTSHFPYSALGEAYLKSKKYDLAERNLKKATNIYSTVANKNNLGASLYNLGMFEEAINRFRQSHSLRNKESYSYYPYFNICLCLAKLSNSKEALEIAQELMRLYSEDSSGEIDIIDIARILYLCGEYSKVREVLRDAFNMFTMNPLDYGIYAYSLNYLGEVQEADKIFEEAIKDNMDNISEISNDNSIDDNNKKARINSLGEEKMQFIAIHDKVNKSSKPLFEYNPYIESDCYLYGCVRHDNPYL